MFSLIQKDTYHLFYLPNYLHSSSVLKYQCIKYQIRLYTPPTNKTWSKQHPRMRIYRPLADEFDASRLQPEKEWWKCRSKYMHSSFMGYPDLPALSIRGGPSGICTMDSTTLAIVIDKCVKTKYNNYEIWNKLCIQSQKLCNKLTVPNICFIFRSHAQMNWDNKHFIISFSGRLQRLVTSFRLRDVGILLETQSVPLYRSERLLSAMITHTLGLLKYRDDATGEDLCCLCRGLLLLREVNDNIHSILKELVRVLSTMQLRKIKPIELSIIIDTLHQLCFRNSIDAIQYLCNYTFKNNIELLDVTSCIRVADAYYACLQYNIKQNHIQSTTLLPMSANGTKALLKDNASTCQNLVTLENTQSENDVLTDSYSSELLIKLANLGSTMTSSDILRCLSLIDSNSLKLETSKQMLSEFIDTLCKYLPRTLLPDICDSDINNVCHALKGFTEAGKYQYVTTCIIPTLLHRLPSTPIPAIIILLQGCRCILIQQTGIFEHQKNIVQEFYKVLISKLENAALNSDQCISVLEALLDTQNVHRYPRFTVNVLQQLLRVSTINMVLNPTDVSIATSCLDSLSVTSCVATSTLAELRDYIERNLYTKNKEYSTEEHVNLV